MQDKCVCLCERKKEKCVDRSGGMSGSRIASGLAAHMTRHRNATVGVGSSICHSDLHLLSMKIFGSLGYFQRVLLLYHNDGNW